MSEKYICIALISCSLGLSVTTISHQLRRAHYRQAISMSDQCWLILSFLSKVYLHIILTTARMLKNWEAHQL